MTTLNRRDFLKLGGASLVLPALSGLAGCGPATPLRVAVQPWCGYQFLFVAQQAGWFADQEIQLVETALTKESVEALKQGRVDAAALTLDEVLLLREQGLPLQVVMVFDVSAGADVLLAKPGITRLEQIKGKRIGVESSSLGSIMLKKVLDAANLQPTQVNVIRMDEDHLQAWENNRMDVILSYEPNLSKLRSLGLKPIFDSRQAPNMILDVLAVTPQAAERHSGALRALIDGYFRALDQWRSNPVNTAYSLAPRLGVEASQVAGVYKGLDLPDAIYNREYLTPPASILQKSAADISAIMIEAGMPKKPQPLNDLFVADFLPTDGGQH